MNDFTPAHNLSYPNNSTVKILPKYVTPAELDTALRSYQHLQNLAPRYINSLSSYFLLYHSPEWIIRNSTRGILEHKGIMYQVVYYGTLTRGKILASAKDGSNIQIACSYRSPMPRFTGQVSPVVLLSIPAPAIQS